MTLTGRTRVAAVLGHPVAHSRSPALHNAAFAAAGIDAVLVPYDVAPGDLAAAVRGLAALGALGASVTVPHKVAIAALCDELAPAATAIGAVNCLAFAGGRVIGHNTDGAGFADALAEVGAPARGARCVLLGAGGAARAVAAGLAEAGAAAVTVVARTPSPWTATVPWTPDALTAALAGADLLVDTTSIALHPDTEAAATDPLPLAALPRSAWVASLVYHRAPRLLARAAAAGHRTLDGAGMLVHQGARAFRLWTGVAPPLDTMRRALAAAVAADS